MRRLMLLAALAFIVGGLRAPGVRAGEAPGAEADGTAGPQQPRSGAESTPPKQEPPSPPPQAEAPGPKTGSGARESADAEKIRQLRREIEELRRRLEGVPEPKPAPTSAEKIAELEAERDRLQAMLDQPLWRFHEDRVSPRAFSLDVGAVYGHTDNLGERHDDKVGDSWFRPEVGLFWGSLDRHWGLGLAAGQSFYDRHDEEDYSDVEFTAVLGSLWYRLQDVSDTSHFVTDRIETTRHTVALGDDWSLRHAAGKQGFEPLDLFAAGEFVSGDLHYDALTLMVGPRWNCMQRTRRGAYDEGLGWQLRTLVGFTRRWYETDDYLDETALVGQLDFAYAGPLWVGELWARSRLEDDLYDKSGHKRVSDAGFKVEQGSGWVRVVYGASAGVEQFDQGDDVTGRKRRDFVARGRLGLDFRLLPHSTVGIYYVPEHHDSNIEEFDATINLFEAGLKLTF